MDTLLTLLWPLIWLIQTLFAIVWWIVWQLLWIALWVLLPVAVLAFVALKIAEKAFGEVAVRAWLKARAARYAGGIGEKLTRGALAASILPFRVLVWFVVYAIWHSVVSLLWRPRWTPWQRAWAKRWKPQNAGGRRAGGAAPARKTA